MNRVPDVSCPAPPPSLFHIQICCCCSSFHLQRPTRNFRCGNKKRQQPAPESRLKHVQERLLKCRWQAPFERHAPLRGKICNMHHKNWPGGLKRGLTSLFREEKTQPAPSLLMPSDPPLNLLFLSTPPLPLSTCQNDPGVFIPAPVAKQPAATQGCVCVCVCV